MINVLRIRYSCSNCRIFSRRNFLNVAFAIVEVTYRANCLTVAPALLRLHKQNNCLIFSHIIEKLFHILLPVLVPSSDPINNIFLGGNSFERLHCVQMLDTEEWALSGNFSFIISGIEILFGCDGGADMRMKVES